MGAYIAARDAAAIYDPRISMSCSTGPAARVAGGDEPAQQCRLLRDIFGPSPFWRMPPLDLAWLTWDGGLVRTLAQAAYDDRHLPSGTLEPARLAVLADALDESGCEDALLLGHLRSWGVHVRGCFAVDLILGRS
jgi:hypothetical protein